MPPRGGSSALPWPFWGFLITVITGLLLGGHQWTVFDGAPVLFSYGYWVLRLVSAYLLFAGGLLLLEISPLGARLEGRPLAWLWLAGLAALLTLPFFTLSVTMLDLLLGLPELGLLGMGLDPAGAVSYSAAAMAKAFALEFLYHVDNYLALCALIVLPRVLLDLGRTQAAEPAASSGAGTPPAGAGVPVALRPAGPTAPAFFERFNPPLKGRVLAVQAQEHYIRVITSEGALTTLYRFGDALRELQELPGLQVHRSFWVADAGVAGLKSGRRGLRIVLRNGEQVPVSAKHAEVVQQRYNARLGTVA